RPKKVAQASPRNQPLSSIRPEPRKSCDAPMRPAVRRASALTARPASATRGANTPTTTTLKRPTQGLSTKNVRPTAARWTAAIRWPRSRRLRTGRRQQGPLAVDELVPTPGQRHRGLGAYGNVCAVTSSDRRIEPDAVGGIVDPRLRARVPHDADL